MARGRRLLLEICLSNRLELLLFFTGREEDADALGSMTRRWTEVVDVGRGRGRREEVVTSWTRV